MGYETLFSIHNLALLSDWLEETKELYVDIYLPHSGGGSTGYIIHSMGELKLLVSQQTWHEIAITIFRQKQYPLRGIADQSLLEQAFQQFPDNQPYMIIGWNLSQFPAPVAFWENGKGHQELRQEFIQFLGEEIAIGQEPFEIYDENWLNTHPNEVFTVTVLRKDNNAIVKNQETYEPYCMTQNVMNG